MARRPKTLQATDAAKYVDEIKGLLDGFLGKLADEDLRRRVVALIPAFHALRDLGSSLILRGEASSARERIIAYLLRYPFVPIDGEEIMVVSGISDWPRRVRELRVELGWSIYSDETIKQMIEGDLAEADAMRELFGMEPSDIPNDHYVLMSAEQDREAAHRWNVSNSIRKEPGSSSERMLKFLRANVGHPVTGEELRYVAKINDWPRRVRELRTEAGWPIFSNFQGRPDLANGSYILEVDEQLPPHDRKIPDPVRVAVLERDDFKCTKCGWSLDKRNDCDPRKTLQLHHVVEHMHGGTNTAENLITLCNVDHVRVHAGTLERVGGIEGTWVEKERVKHPQ